MVADSCKRSPGAQEHSQGVEHEKVPKAEWQPHDCVFVLVNANATRPVRRVCLPVPTTHFEK